MEPVDRFLLGRVASAPRVVCLPTAAGAEGAERTAYWSRLGVEHFARLGAHAEAVPIVDRGSAEDEALAARIRAANFVYLSGGDPDYLFKTLSGAAAWRAVKDVLDHGGVVAGCSAGAMICGGYYPTFPTLWPWRRAFNLAPQAVVVPHFDEMPAAFAWLVKAMLPPASILLGVEGNTALVLRDDASEVVGAGGVTVWDRRRKRRYVHGERVAWGGAAR
jgi:cyanophycinase